MICFVPGAMLAICDVNEYRKCMKEFHIPLVTHLFDTLHSLCNLLVVVPENLKHACTGEMLVSTRNTFGPLVPEKNTLNTLSPLVAEKIP